MNPKKFSAYQSEAQAVIAEQVRRIVETQNQVVDAACWEAMREGYTVHVTTYYGTRYLGIEFVLGPVRVVYHSDSSHSGGPFGVGPYRA